MILNDNKNKKFRLFDLNRDGRGVEKKDVVTSTGFKGFFYRYKNSFSKLLSVNIIYVIGNIFLIFLIMAIAGYTKKTFFRPVNDFFAAFSGVFGASGDTSAAGFAFSNILGQSSQELASTKWTYIFYGLSAITLLTFGPVNAGCTYLLRNMIMGEPVFAVSDFFYSVKRNLKQSLILGVIDGLIMFLIPYNIYSMFTATEGYLVGFMLWMNIVLLILYTFMRFYMYLILITFDLKLTKIIKNAFIFAFLGFKRNIVAFIGIILLLIPEVIFLLFSNGYLLALAVGYPLLLLFSHMSFCGCYAAYYTVKKYMIDPLPEEELNKDNDIQDE